MARCSQRAFLLLLSLFTLFGVPKLSTCLLLEWAHVPLCFSHCLGFPQLPTFVRMTPVIGLKIRNCQEHSPKTGFGGMVACIPPK